MNVAEWILVVMLSVTLLIFLIAAIVLVIKLIFLADEAKKIIATGQGIAAKADDIIDNVKGMTSVGGIVKTFANRVMENQERRYAAEDAEREAAREFTIDEAEQSVRQAKAAEQAAKASATAAKARATAAKSNIATARANTRAAEAAKRAKKS